MLKHPAQPATFFPSENRDSITTSRVWGSSAQVMLVSLLAFMNLFFHLCWSRTPADDGLVAWTLEVHAEGVLRMGVSPPCSRSLHSCPLSSLPGRGKAPCPQACRGSCSGSHRSTDLPQQHPECTKTPMNLLAWVVINI